MSPAERPALPLRPHHGLCLAFYQGHGYSEGFTRRTSEVLALLLRENPTVRLAAAPDGLCLACPNRRGDGCESGEKVLAHDRAVLALCSLREGETLPFRAFAERVQERILTPGRRREVCGGCRWERYCMGNGRWAELSQKDFP